MRSQARLVYHPLQDYMGLDNKCRINTPSTVGENWKWRLLPRPDVTEALLENHRGCHASVRTLELVNRQGQHLTVKQTHEMLPQNS